MKSKSTNKIKARTIILLIIVVPLLLIIFFKNQPEINSSTNSKKDKIPVMNNQPKVPKPKLDPQLEQLISTWAQKQSSEYSIEINETNGQLRTAQYNASKPMVPASTYKLFVAYVVLHKVQTGEYSLETKTRNGKSIHQCLEKMIVSSDNDCGRALGFLIGWSDIDRFLHAKGYKDTILNNYDENNNLLQTDKISTANDINRLLVLLEKGQLLDKTHSGLMIDMMKRQIWRERIASGVPGGVVVAGKPGWLTYAQTDAAIIYGPKSTYTLTILSNSSNAASLAELSRIVYEYLNS